MLSQLLHGAQVSLLVGFVAGGLSTVVAVLIGLSWGYLRGFVADAINFVVNLFLVIPGLPLVIVISGFVPQEQRGLWTIGVVLAITGWAASSRVLRAQTLSIRSRDYVAAARVAGEKPWRVISVEILPNLLPVLASQFVFAVIAAILGEAGLSFLGLGVPITEPSLGLLIANGYEYMLSGKYWISFYPGIALLITIVSINLVGDHLRDVLNPRLKK